MKTFGGFLVIASIIFWFFSIRMDITEMNMSFEIVKSGSLMQKQIIYTNTAGILFLAGIFLLGLGQIEELLKGKLYSIVNKLPELKKPDTSLST